MGYLYSFKLLAFHLIMVNWYKPSLIYNFWLFSGNNEYYMSVDVFQLETARSTLACPTVQVDTSSCLYFSYRLSTIYCSLHLTANLSGTPLASLYFSNYSMEDWARTAVTLPEGDNIFWFVASCMGGTVDLKSVRLEQGVCDLAGEFAGF